MKSLFIVGPTAVGKTALAFSLTRKFPSVLISADSAQVFQGTDIITGKDLPAGTKFDRDHYEFLGTFLFLLDVVEPTESFSVNNFVNLVRPIVSRALNEKKLPIIVGGTRFYVHALTNRIDTISIPPDEVLRKKLSKKTLPELQGALAKLDAEKFKHMNNSDKNNPRRLIRAIEVFGSKNQKNAGPIFKKEEVVMVGLKSSFEVIKQKINDRIEKRIEQGAIEEAKKLFDNYENLSEQVKALSGFNQFFEYFKGDINLNEAIEKWKISEYQLARDQLSWLKSPDIITLDVEKKGFEDKIMRLIKHEFSL